MSRVNPTMDKCQKDHILNPHNNDNILQMVLVEKCEHVFGPGAGLWTLK